MKGNDEDEQSNISNGIILNNYNLENETQSICNYDLGNLKVDFIKSLCENSVLNNVNKYIFRKKYHWKWVIYK